MCVRVHERGSWKPPQTGWPQLTPAVQSAGCLKIDCFVFERGSRSYNLGAAPRVTQAAVESVRARRQPREPVTMYPRMFYAPRPGAAVRADVIRDFCPESRLMCWCFAKISAWAQQDRGRVRDSGSVEDGVASATEKLVWELGSHYLRGAMKWKGTVLHYETLLREELIRTT